jgi:hypothetical protein
MDLIKAQKQNEGFAGMLVQMNQKKQPMTEVGTFVPTKSKDAENTPLIFWRHLSPY